MRSQAKQGIAMQENEAFDKLENLGEFLEKSFMVFDRREMYSVCLTGCVSYPGDFLPQAEQVAFPFFRGSIFTKRYDNSGSGESEFIN